MAKKKSRYHAQKSNFIFKEFHLFLFMLKDFPTPVRTFSTNGGHFIEILLYKEKMEMAKSRISFSHFN